MDTRKKRELTEFGVTVKKKLVEVGMTQRELAERVGCKHVYLNIMLHGLRSGRKYKSRICEVLDLGVEK